MPRARSALTINPPVFITSGVLLLALLAIGVFRAEAAAASIAVIVVVGINLVVAFRSEVRPTDPTGEAPHPKSA